MKAYILTMLVIHAVSVLLSCIVIAHSEYPRQQKSRSLGYDMINLFLVVAFLIWTFSVYKSLPS